MGVWFNDPDVEMDEIIWYNILAIHMLSKTADKDLISTNEEFGTASCRMTHAMLSFTGKYRISYVTYTISFINDIKT